jgi:hypothetical protein
MAPAASLTSDSPPSALVRRWLLVAAGIVCLCLFAAIALADFQRGPWYDEFYTLHVTQAGTGIWHQLTASWLPDNHPPAYYMLARATAWLGDTAEPRRLLNVAIGAGCLALGAMAVRETPGRAPVAALLVLALAAHPAAMLTGTELRSYFLSLCGAALLVLALTNAWLEGAVTGRWSKAALLAGFAIAFNTHIVTTIITGALAAPFLAAALLRRDRALFSALLVPAVIAAALFTGVTAIQAASWEHNTAAFWIVPGWDAAKWTLYHFAIRAITAMPVMTACAGVGLAMMARDFVRTRRMGRDAKVVELLCLGCLLAVGLLIALHMNRPLVTERYLVALVAALAMMAALPASRLLAALPRFAAGAVLLAMVLNGLAAIEANFGAAVHRNSWNGTARAIAAEVRACPDTAVHVLPVFNAAAMALPPADNRHTFPFAYALMAREYGFRIEPAGSHRQPRDCPTLFWAEHDSRRVYGARAVIAEVRREGFRVDRIQLRRIGDGWVAHALPSPAPLTPLTAR